MMIFLLDWAFEYLVDRYKFFVAHGHTHQWMEPINPKVPFFGCVWEEDVSARGRCQLEAELPRALLPGDGGDLWQALDTDKLTPMER